MNTKRSDYIQFRTRRASDEILGLILVVFPFLGDIFFSVTNENVLVLPPED